MLFQQRLMLDPGGMPLMQNAASRAAQTGHHHRRTKAIRQGNQIPPDLSEEPYTMSLGESQGPGPWPKPVPSPSGILVCPAKYDQIAQQTASSAQRQSRASS